MHLHRGYVDWKMERASLAHFRRFLAEPDMAERPIQAANAQSLIMIIRDSLKRDSRR